MPSKQRENARIEKQQKNERRIKIIIWTALILIVFVLIVMKVAEIDFSDVKKRFTDENGHLSFSMTTEEDAYPFTLDSSSGVKVNSVNDKLVALTDISCTVLNPVDAKPVYSFTHGYANPIMSYSGKYMCTIDQGATRLRLDTTNGEVYETKADYAILCADVAKNGNVIYATRSSDNDISITVETSSRKKITNFKVKTGYVVAVAIDNSGRKFAYAAVNSKDAKLVCSVYTFTTGNDEPKASFDFTDSNIMDLHYANSGDLYYVATNGVSLIKSQKNLKTVLAQGSANTVCFNYTSDNELVYVYSKYSDANENHLAYINSSGKIKTTINLKQKPKYVCAENDICLLFSDKVVTYSLTKGEKRDEYKCDDSVNNVNKMSSKIFVSRHQLVDVLN